MTKANLSLLLLAGATASAPLAAAQTGSSTAHHTASTAAHRAAAARSTGAGANACITIPKLGAKFPALPAGSPCPKPLFTISERLDAISPMVGPEVREGFNNLPMTFTLAYVDQKIGTGELAKPKMWYTVNYTGYLTDGTKFDSSYDHPDKKPISFPYGAHRVIPGWDTGFEGMHVGGKRRLFVPFQLAYGAAGHPPIIPAKAELVFDMELVSMSAEDPTPKPPTPPIGAGPVGASPANPIGARPTTPGQPGSLPATPPTGAAPGSTAPVTPSPTPATPPPAPATPPVTTPKPPSGNQR